jgi:ATP-binding cassette subfamily B (MDR/TAP) protein 1
VATVPIVLVLVPFFSNRAQRYIQAQAVKLSEATKLATNTFNNIETIKCYNGEDVELWRYSKVIGEAGKFFYRQACWNGLQGSILRMVTLSMFVQGFWYGGTLVDRGEKAVSDILTAFWAAVLATGALMQIMPHLVVLEKGRAAGQKLRAVMVQIEARSSDAIENGSQFPKRCVGDVTFSNVSFAYPSLPQQVVLRDVNLFFAAGETTFVIGKSGSGKSTIGQLLLKFYSPSHGNIELDGQILARLESTWIRQNVLLVEQQSILFNTTIHENISMGKMIQTDIGHEEVLNAADFAIIRKVIEKMPKGFDTIVGNKGASLSGGQRQRIALARAWLRDPPLLILDESTSALDYVNRVAVVDAIRRWRKGKTTIIITHDISQVLPDDFVYVMRDGKVVEEGFRKSLNTARGSPFHDFITMVKEAEKVVYSQAQTESWPHHRENISPINSKPSSSKHVDMLDVSLHKPRNRSSFVLSSYFSRNPAPANRPEGSIRVPSVIAPLWKVTPQLLSPDQESHPFGSDGSTSSSISDITNAKYKVFPRIRARFRQLGTDTALTIRRQINRLSILRRESSAKPLLVDIELQKPPSTRKRSTGRESSKSVKIYTMRQILATVWPLFDWKQRCYLILAVFGTTIWAISTPMFSFVFSKLLSTIYTSEQRKTKALKYSLAVLGVAITDGISLLVSHSQFQRCGQIWINKLRVNALRFILAQPRQFFDEKQNEASRLAEHLDHHAEEMQHILGRFLGYMLTVTIMISTAVIWSLVTCWKLTFVLMACSPALYAITIIMKAVSGAWDTRCVDAVETAGSIFAETFTSIRTVRSLTLEDHFRKKHTKACDTALGLGIQRALYCGIVFGLSEAAFMFLTALIFHYGAVLVASGEWPLNDIFQVFTLLLFSVSNATMILAFIPQMSMSRDAAGRLLRLVTLPQACHEHEGEVRIPSVGHIALHNVNFSYPNRPDAPVLTDVNLSIPAGSCVALVGLSGSGKSTIASLLLNLYTVKALPSSSSLLATPGKTSDITFSNRSIKRIHTPTLRSLIAIVSQTPTLFPATIAANIAYGLHSSSPLNTIANIASAAEAAGIHDFITSLPQGYETLIGEGGTGLSGGQAQRIAIARALVRRPNVLILDEATSALDIESAAVVRDTIRKLLAADRALRDEERGAQISRLTVIIITHARDMMRVADWICMLDKGKVVEVGAYDELVRQGGTFSKLVRGQAWEDEEARAKTRSLIRMSKIQGLDVGDFVTGQGHV